MNRHGLFQVALCRKKEDGPRGTLTSKDRSLLIRQPVRVPTGDLHSWRRTAEARWSLPLLAPLAAPQEAHRSAPLAAMNMLKLIRPITFHVSAAHCPPKTGGLFAPCASNDVNAHDQTLPAARATANTGAPPAP